MKRFILWTATAVLCAAIGGLSVWLTLDGRLKEHSQPPNPPTNGSVATRPIAYDDEGYTVVTLEPQAVQRFGIQVRRLATASRQPEVNGRGVLQDDPSRMFTVRAPAPGTVRGTELVRWPSPGDLLTEGTIIGWIEPRSASDDRSSTTTATATPDDETTGPAAADLRGSAPLRLEVTGKVLELAAHPGEHVANGQPILRLIRWDRLLARVTLPPGLTVNAPVNTARLAVTGHDDWLVQGHRLPPASSTDPVTGGQTFLFAVLPGDLPLQPGMTVSAHLPLPGPPVEGVLVPRSATVRYAGHTWIYIQTGQTSFTRRPMPAGIPTDEGLFVTEGLLLGERAVIAGAANLLAEELRLRPPDDD